jgi:hypothetical protein
MFVPVLSAEVATTMAVDVNLVMSGLFSASYSIKSLPGNIERKLAVTAAISNL